MKNQALAILVALSVLAVAPAMAQESPTFDQPETELSGRLLASYVMLSSGKMLSGEILYLDDPIVIVANNQSENRRNRKSAKNVSQILLEFEGAANADDLAGDIVRVTGRLINEASDPFHTDVKMVVTDIALIEASEGERPVATFKTH